MATDMSLSPDEVTDHELDALMQELNALNPLKYKKSKEHIMAQAMVVYKSAENLPRHPAVENQKSEYLERIEEDFKLDQELGLRGQVENKCVRSVKHDTDTLVKDTQYMEVTLKDIEQKIFKMERMKDLCVLHNILSFLKFSLPMVLSLSSAVFMPIIAYHIFGTPKLFSEVWYVVPLVLLGLAIFAFFFYKEKGFKIIKCKLVHEDTKVTKMDIPYGAKLKMKEAKDLEIFDKFLIFYPKLEERNISQEEFIEMITPRLDPAVCGVYTIDGKEHWYLIVFWDVKKDIERMFNSIKKNFKDLKLA